jgi:hypothetical protein
MPRSLSLVLSRVFGGKRGFIVVATLAFAACFLLSELGRARHWLWLTSWPPLLFVFTVPPEYRWRFATRSWAREVFVVMSSITAVGLAIAGVIEVIIGRSRSAATPAPPVLAPDLVKFALTVAIGGLLFGLLSLFSAWGLYSVFYRPEGPISRRRSGPPTQGRPP